MIRSALTGVQGTFEQRVLQGLWEAYNALPPGVTRRSKFFVHDWSAADIEPVELRTRTYPVPREEIFKRDGYECWLCGTPTRKGLPYNHHLSPVVDHCIPHSKGGSNELDNLKTAHYVCNARKKDTMPNIYFERIEKAFGEAATSGDA